MKRYEFIGMSHQQDLFRESPTGDYIRFDDPAIAAAVTAMEDGIRIIEGLAEQQAMHDDWYVVRLERLRLALAPFAGANEKPARPQ